MHKKHSSHKKTAFGKDLIILPIAFCVLIFAICLIVLLPASSSFRSTAKMFFSDNEKNFSNDYVNIFVPVEEDSEISELSEVSHQTSKTEESSQAPVKPQPKTPKTVSISSFTFPCYENQFGELIIEDCQIHANLFFGDSDLVLRYGVGIYNGSFIPGYGKTILVAGHNNTYFNGLKYAQKGQIVKIRTNYGNYKYEITDMQVRDMSDRTAYDLNATTENLIMYTCYPFDELGLTPNRYFVYAKLVSGPVIDKNS